MKVHKRLVSCACYFNFSLKSVSHADFRHDVLPVRTGFFDVFASEGRHKYLSVPAFHALGVSHISFSMVMGQYLGSGLRSAGRGSSFDKADGLLPGHLDLALHNPPADPCPQMSLLKGFFRFSERCIDSAPAACPCKTAIWSHNHPPWRPEKPDLLPSSCLADTTITGVDAIS